MSSRLAARDIEQAARELLASMEARKVELWNDALELSLFDIVDPEVGASHLGYTVHYMEELGGSDRRDVAAILDMENRRIYVSRLFPPDQIRFAVAHELGHIVLGHRISGLHRERPIRGYESTFSRGQLEVEADRFAAAFLMPPRLLKKVFEERFGPVPFRFDDASAYALCPDDPDSLLRPDRGSRARGLALASARAWRGKHYYALCAVFKVSVSAMGIRLEELGLVARDRLDP